MPCPRIFETKIAKGESRDKEKMEFSQMVYAEPSPILSKDSERREQRQRENEIFTNGLCRAASYILQI